MKLLTLSILTTTLLLTLVVPSGSSEEAIRQTVTPNGTVVLTIPPVAGEDELQEYSVRRSTDLRDWSELDRARLVEPLEVRDHQEADEPSRFYQVVPVETSEAVRVFADEMVKELESLETFASGIVLEGLTLDEYRELQLTISETREMLAVILESGEPIPDILLRYYQERVREIDTMLARQPLHLTSDGRTYEVNVSEAMRILAEEYKRLGLVSLDDYDRLPGIDSEDLEGHETLPSYFAARQIGDVETLPVFYAFSPYGNFTLTHSLILKHLDILSESVVDTDKDGAWEIDYELYRRLLNGSERAFRESKAIAETVTEANPVQWDRLKTTVVSNQNLGAVLIETETKHLALAEQLEQNVMNKNYEDVFEKSILDETHALLNLLFFEDQERLRKAIQRESVTLQLFPGFEAEPLANPTTPEALSARLLALENWYSEIQTSVLDFLAGQDLPDRLVNGTLSILNGKLLGYTENDTYREGLAARERDALFEAVRENVIDFELAGIGEATLTLDWEDLYEILKDLLRVPGLSELVSEEKQEALHRERDWAYLFSSPIGTSIDVEATSLSTFGGRVELIALLAEAVGPECIVDGEIDISVIITHVLGADEYKEIVSTAMGRASSSIADIEAFSASLNQGLSSDQYLELMRILRETRSRIAEEFGSSSLNPDDPGSHVIKHLAQSAYTPVYEAAKAILAGSTDTGAGRNVRLEIGGTGYSFDIDWMRSVVERALGRVAIRWDFFRTFDRYQYLRLQIVDEDYLLNLSNDTFRSELPVWNWSSYHYPVTLKHSIGKFDEEYLLFPKLIESLGTAILDENGAVDDRLIEAGLLAKAKPKVAAGQSLVSVHRERMDALSKAALPEMEGLNFANWEAWERGEALLLELARSFAAFSEPLVDELSDVERQMLGNRVSRLSSYWQLHRLYAERLEHGNVVLEVEEGRSLAVDFEELFKVVDFGPNCDTLDSEVFANVRESDLATSRLLREEIAYSVDGSIGDEQLFQECIDFRKLIVSIVRRLAANPNDIPEASRNLIFAEDRLNSELFRRYVKGIDGLHQEVVAFVEQLVQERRQIIQSLRVEPMTTVSIGRVYDVVKDLRADIMEYLEDRTAGHDDADAVEMEEALSAVYNAALEDFVSYVKDYPLAVSIEGQNVIVPVSQVLDVILGELHKLYPGESLHAHHFASLPGIAVADLRSFEMLEDFLGNQIIALPRTSQEVEVSSKLSELGMLQLISSVLQRFGTDVIDIETNTVDADALLERLQSDSLALERALQRVDALFDSGLERIEAVSNPATNEGFEELNRLSVLLKLEVLDELNDFVSHFSIEAFEHVQQRVDLRLRDFVEKRDALVMGSSIEIDAIDGSVVMVDIAALETEFVELFRRLIGEPVVVEHTTVTEWSEDFDAPHYFIQPSWQPQPIQYRPEDRVTRFGFHHLVTRLIRKFGHLTIEADAFSMERFAEELQRRDRLRAEAIFERIYKQELAALEALLPSGDDAITVAMATSIADQLDSSRNRFFIALNTLEEEPSYFRGIAVIDGSARSRWHKVIDYYEAEMMGRDIVLSLDGIEVTLPTTALVEQMYAVYGNAHTGVLDSYVEGGESESDYHALRYLNQVHPYHIYASSIDDSVFGSMIGEEEQDGESSYSFRLGDLAGLPGVSVRDLQALDVLSDSRVVLAQLDPEELLRGTFNMRAISPGGALLNSSIISGNRTAIYASSIDDWGNLQTFGGYLSPSYDPKSFLELSWRDVRYRLLVELIKDHADVLVSGDGIVDLEAFALLLADAESG